MELCWKYNEKKLPGTNCIVFADGSVIILSYYTMYDPNIDKMDYFCVPVCDTTLDSIGKYGSTGFVIVDEWAGIDYNGGKIISGDGQMGNEGFVAHIDNEQNLIWGIFFTNTNPLKNLTVNKNILTAISEHDELRIDINLEKLTDIKIFSLEKL